MVYINAAVIDAMWLGGVTLVLNLVRVAYGSRMHPPVANASLYVSRLARQTRTRECPSTFPQASPSRCRAAGRGPRRRGRGTRVALYFEVYFIGPTMVYGRI